MIKRPPEPLSPQTSSASKWRYQLSQQDVYITTWGILPSRAEESLLWGLGAERPCVLPSQSLHFGLGGAFAGKLSCCDQQSGASCFLYPLLQKPLAFPGERKKRMDFSFPHYIIPIVSTSLGWFLAHSNSLVSGNSPWNIRIGPGKR